MLRTKLGGATWLRLPRIVLVPEPSRSSRRNAPTEMQACFVVFIRPPPRAAFRLAARRCYGRPVPVPPTCEVQGAPATWETLHFELRFHSFLLCHSLPSILLVSCIGFIVGVPTELPFFRGNYRTVFLPVCFVFDSRRVLDRFRTRSIGHACDGLLPPSATGYPQQHTTPYLHSKT